MNTTHPASTRPLAVVTGASSGIGRALAVEFAQNGFDLLLVAENDLSASAADAAAADAASRSATLVTDLTTSEGVERLVQTLEGEQRPLEAIAINAGVGVGGSFLETALDEELKMIDLNVTSTVHLAKRVLPGMVARKQGRILFTSSVAALMPDPYEAVYGASKAFVKTFAESLRAELKDTGVTVTTMMPGPTETNFFHRAGMDDTKVGSDKKDDAADVARQGVRALLDGKAELIVGSLKTKAQADIISALPLGAAAELHRSMAEPGSAKS